MITDAANETMREIRQADYWVAPAFRNMLTEEERRYASALLVILWPGAKLEAKQVRRISRFQENAIPIYYSGSPHGIYSAVVGAAQSIDLGMNYYP